MAFLMSDILDDIRTLAANEIEDLGSDSTTQNAAIFRFVNMVLDKRARQAYNVAFSDTLNIAADGYQTFKKDTSDITDLYEPLDIYGPTGTQTAKRTSYDGPKGWWRESDNLEIHTKQLTGDHTLKYIRYAATITTSTDTIEYPRAGKADLIYDVVALVKLIKNFYQESDAIKARATGTATTRAAIDAKGSISAPPSVADKED